jgi:cytochrome c oxidase subunit 3
LVERGFQIGILLFIFSEVLFFISFFWTFFHRRIAPNSDLGISWPPFRLEGIGPFEIPLLNTLVLLRRGITVTWSHYLLLQNLKREIPLIITLILGIYFTILQGFEYLESRFTFSDSVFGRVFFIATGFHGIHVLIGSILLIYSLFRIILSHFTLFNPIGYEISIWYWHFVDVVWLFLFSFIYWWGF